MKEITTEQKMAAAKDYAYLKVRQSCGAYNKVDHLMIKFAHMAGQDCAKEQYTEKWIDAKESLPEQSGQVLGIMKDTLDIYVCHYKQSRKLFLVYGAGADPISDMKVTHWMPLPYPPQECIDNLEKF